MGSSNVNGVNGPHVVAVSSDLRLFRGIGGAHRQNHDEV